jgi:hypothetical protein
VACGTSGSGQVSVVRVAMSAAAAAPTPRCPRWWSACRRWPDTRPGARLLRTPVWPSTLARSCVPDTSCPEGGCPGSSGQSIRRSLRLVTTSSALLRPPAGPAATPRSPGNRSQQPEQDDRGRVLPASTLYARWPSRSCRSAVGSCSSTGVTAVARVHLKLVGCYGQSPDLDHLQAMRQDSVQQAPERGLVLHRAVQHHLRRLHADRQAPGLALERGQDRVLRRPARRLS